jgi:hypothetical protein
VAPFALDPNSATHNHLILGGGGYVCETIDGGAHWILSNFNDFFHFFVQSVAIAPANSAVEYAGTNNGHIWRTASGNTGTVVTWTDVFTGKGLPTTPVTSITVDRNDATGNIAYATFGDFGVGHVWKTIDGGTNWINISGNLPNAPVESITTYPSSPNPVLVVGTDVGVFLSTDNGGAWSTLMNGLPNTVAMMVFTDTAMTTLFVASHGRGMWMIPIPDGFPTLTLTGITPPSSSLNGGISVTITGTDFRPGVSVFFDGIAATGAMVVNPTTITAVTPAHQSGVANVTVMNSDNRGATLTQVFTFGVVNSLPPSRPAGTLNGSPPSPLPGGRPPTGPIDPNTPPPLPGRRP